MNKKLSKNSIIIFVIGLMAIGFGVITIMSGGFALFGGEAGEEFAGNYVALVLWFNFISGFFYIISGLGVVLKKNWGVITAKILAQSTVVVFLVFLVMVLSGVEYEIRTMGAMTVRSVFWVVLFLVSRKLITGVQQKV